MEEVALAAQSAGRMLKLICRPASTAMQALAGEGASRLAAIDPRLEYLRLCIKGEDAPGAGNGTEAHLELRLPERQLILNRRHPRDSIAAAHEAVDAAAVALQEIARRDGVRRTAFPPTGLDLDQSSRTIAA